MNFTFYLDPWVRLVRQPLANALTTPELRHVLWAISSKWGFGRKRTLLLLVITKREAWLSYLPCRNFVREGYMAIECIEHTDTDFTFEEYRQWVLYVGLYSTCELCVSCCVFCTTYRVILEPKLAAHWI